MEKKDAVTLALDHSIKIRRLTDLLAGSQRQQGDNKGLGEGFKRRAKDLPSLVLSVGLVPALTFYMSKSDEYAYKLILNYLRKGELLQLSENDKEKLENELGKGEKAGYSTILALTLTALAEMDAINKKIDELEDFAKIVEVFKSLHEKSGKEMAAENLLLDYLIEVKKLAEALF